MRVKEENGKSQLKTKHPKNFQLIAFSLITPWQIEGASLVAQSVKNLPVVHTGSNPWVGKIP